MAKRVESEIAEATRAVEVAQAKLAQVRAEGEAEVTQFDAAMDAARAGQVAVETQIAEFRRRAAIGDIEEFGPQECFDLLSLLGVTSVSPYTLHKQQVVGAVLLDLTESDMKSAFQMTKLGDRRRLKLALRRLANRQGFLADANVQHGAFTWDENEVCAWLTREGFSELVSLFQAEGIDGACLLELDLDDQAGMGIGPLGVRYSLNRRIQALRKQTFAGAAVAATPVEGADAAAAAAVGGGGEVATGVLAAVLAENRSLRETLERARPRICQEESTPPQFYCPILHEIMVDPVLAMDGYTYERQAIEAWYRRSDRSPMTNTIVHPTLIENLMIRQQIAALDSEPPK